MINLLIVDDHVLFREGLTSLIKSQPDFRVLGEAGSVEEAVEMARNLRPDVVLMDFSLPDGTGLEATQAILAEKPDTRIVFLTVHEEDERLFAAIRSGARGYLLKNLPVTKLLASLRGMERGEAPLSRAMTSRVLNAFSTSSISQSGDRTMMEQLTDREQEVLREVARGSTNREIAQRLYISENTVKNHIHSILKKLNLSNRRELMRFAERYGLRP